MVWGWRGPWYEGGEVEMTMVWGWRRPWCGGGEDHDVRAEKTMACGGGEEEAVVGVTGWRRDLGPGCEPGGRLGGGRME